VELQYFALRWLQVFFGREFCLNDFFVVWDEIFAFSNDMMSNNDEEYIILASCAYIEGHSLQP
jgi:hypothetical protein